MDHLGPYLMAIFPLLQLPSALLERIISKLEWKSYFRLQRTCQYLEELVRTNKNIYIYWNADKNIPWKKSRNNGPLVLWALLNYSFVDIRCIYGFRFKQLSPDINVDNLDYYNRIFKQNRITCKRLYLCRRYNQEQYVEIFKTLKPREVKLASADTNAFEALLNHRILEEVEMEANRSEILINDMAAVRQLARKVRILKIHLCVPGATREADRDGVEELFELFKRIRQFLLSETLSKLNELEITGHCKSTYTSVDEAIAIFNEFNPVKLDNTENTLFGPHIQYTYKIQYNCKINITNVGESGYYAITMSCIHPSG